IVLLAFSSCQSSSELDNQKVENCLITVSGEGVVTVDPDVVNFSIRISEIAPTTGEAQIMANKKIAKVFEILDAFDIDSKDIKTTNLSFNTEYNWVDGKQEFEGERATQSINVKMKTIEKFDELVTTIGQNITGLSFNSVNFDKDDKSEGYSEARMKALKDAKEKAEIYAQTAGMILKTPLQISEGSFNTSSYRSMVAPTAMLMESKSAESSIPLTQAPSGQIEISVSINVVYQAI
ncbi:MAG: SIMPL domain-containing protein, partial [Sphaerochaetaceae bacterium]|nr:SIMPL domain-containing protein [Sphaerochaetaceae bacterium]